MRLMSEGRRKKAEGLYRSHARRLFDFAFRKTRDEHAAEDVVQETLGVALEKDAPPGNEGPWLFRIARNKLFRLAEKKTRRRERVLDAASSERPAEPGEALDLGEEKARVARALTTLSPELGEVIHLLYVERLSHREIAERLSIPASTVQ